jgi:hypothetical protein
MGKLYEDHYHHHVTIYPPDDYLSDDYREPPTGSEQGIYYLIPILILSLAVVPLGWYYGLLARVEGVAVLKANAYVHDALHIRGHKWEKHAWYHHLRWLHFQHHVDVATNLGIFVWYPDRLFGSYVPVEGPPEQLRSEADSRRATHSR